MHPLFSSKAATAVYFWTWVPLAGLLRLLFAVTAGFNVWESIALTIPLCLIYSFVCLSPWYLCRMLPIAPGQFGRILRSHLAAAGVAGLFWIVVAKALGLLLTRWDQTADQRLGRTLPMLFVIGLLLYFLAVSLHYVLLSFESSQAAAVAAEQARGLAREAELRALKAQINPHFLFNSLNSISALTMIDPARARQMCIHLSDFLRSTLSLGDKASISFADELSLTRTYLSVEQVRFGARLRVEENVGPECNGCNVPPLLMQPLVENAIKHGIAGLVDGGAIRLEARCQDGRLYLSVANEFDPDAPARRKSGVGLPNVRNRLRTRYEHRARLDTQVKDNQFLVELSLPCQERPVE